MGSKSQSSIDDIKYNDEYISYEEHKLLLGNTPSILTKIEDDTYILDRNKICEDYGIKPEDSTSIRPEIARYINNNYVPKSIKTKSFNAPAKELEEIDLITLHNQVEHFINTILHIIIVGGDKAWDCICIGSDFDGLISPIRKIKNITDLPKLRSSTAHFIKQNPNLWMAFNVNSYEDIDTKVQKLFFENGKRFIEAIL